MNIINSKILIIDGSMLIHRNLKVPQLYELVNNNGIRTGGIFGVLNSLQSTMKKFPDYYPIITWDSGLSPRRVEIYPNYKKSLDKLATKIVESRNLDESSNDKLSKYKEKHTEEKYMELKESINMIMNDRSNWSSSDISNYKESKEESLEYVSEYHRQRDLLIQILSNLGIPSIKYDRWEGDDLMVLLKRMSTSRSVVMTDDKDLIQLIDSDTDIWRPIQDKYLEFHKYMPENDLDSYREIVIHKAIVGDGSDNIPAVTSKYERKYSIGSTRAKKVAKLIYKTGEDKQEEYLQILRDTGKNYYKGFIDNIEDYNRNMELVDLDLVPNDKDIIWNITQDISKTVGQCDFFAANSLVKELEINNIDLNFMISRIMVLSSKFDMTLVKE